ncbi:hypothetical protein ACPCAG_31375 [Streptomyces pseudogriseolus]|uniref:hypothetical protein n=1 Tax=Streptomyces pseudogriseolus TaxID=36817 RepID=UPI003FA257A7
MSATPHALAAAHRARTIAAIARTRATSLAFPLSAENRVFAQWISTLLTDAADALETTEALTMDGFTVRNTIDSHAAYCLHRADEIAADVPAIGFPPLLTRYVTVPVFGNAIPLPASLLPGGVKLVAQEGDLFARLLALHGNYLAVADAEEDRETTAAALEAAFTLHWKHAQLAESAAADAGRPCGPASTPDAEPAPLNLTGLTPYTVGVIRLAEREGLRATDAGTHRGVRRIALNAGGKHGTFGTLQIGARSGKVLRVELIHGNDGTPRRAQGAMNVRLLLAAERIHACPDDCTAFTTAACRP